MTAHVDPVVPAQHVHVAGPTGAIPAPPIAGRWLSIRSRMVASRVIGSLFLLGFVFYGTGSLLMVSLTGGDGFLADVPSHKVTLVVAGLLMLANTATDIGKAVLFFPVVDRYGRRTALAYLGTMVFEVAVMAVGVLALLTLAPLAD